MMWMVWLFLPLILVPVATYMLTKNKKSPVDQTNNEEVRSIGSYSLDIKEKKLLHNEKNEMLTDKEMRLLILLLEKKDEVLNRDFLMNEIWAAGGLIVVSKNLDVLVSKIRKKLSLDERIKITSVHGVGYKLEVSE